MPRSNGVYTLPPGYQAVTGETVLASQHNPPLEDLGASMTNSLPRDGQAPMTGNLPMGGFKITNLGEATLPTDAARLGQVMSAPASGVDGNLLSFDGSATVAQDSGVPAAQVARLDQENTLDGGNPMRFVSTQDGAEGAGQDFYHNSPSPAANDVIHRSRFYGEDDGGNKTLYAELLAKLLDPADTAEEAILSLSTMVAGVLAERFHFGAGIYAEGLTDQGAGTVNAASYSAGDSPLPFQRSFESTAQTITQGALLTLAHGFGEEPKLIQYILECTIADQGYSPGDRLMVVGAGGSGGTGSFRGNYPRVDDTNIYIRLANVSGSSSSWIIQQKDTGDQAPINNASWDLYVRAWA